MTDSSATRDLSGIRQQLESLLAEFENRLGHLREDVMKPTSKDWEEQATELENSEVMDALGLEAETEVRKIKQAIARLDAGEFGYCADCGVEIPVERLKARPFSSRCVDCAEAQESLAH